MRPTFGQQLHPLAGTCRIDLVDGALAITSPYDADFVMALKTVVPGSDRKWDSASKRWIVTINYLALVRDLIERHYGVIVIPPDVTRVRVQNNEMRLLDVRYIGAAKTREDGAETAFAWSSGGWNVIFPKPVLLEWFGQTSRPDEAQTYYGVLGVSQDVDQIELKKAWKRLARTWHPDVSKEPGSREQFQAIQEAYDVLSSPQMRAKYNAGLAFEAMSKAHSQRANDTVAGWAKVTEWRSPLRCGLILVEGQSRLGRFVVSKILQWQDLVNEFGEVLVTSWAMGDDKFTEAWVVP